VALDFEEFTARLDKGAFQAVDFVGDLLVGQLPLGNGRVRFAENKDFPSANASGNRYAPDNLFTPARCHRHGSRLAGNRRFAKSSLPKKLA
jgi:hypothetical protein